MDTSKKLGLLSDDSFFWSKNRLKTYTYWPFQDSKYPCNPKQMAAAGFIASDNQEEPDTVECVFCYKKLDGWVSNDDPWLEHARHQGTCPLVVLDKKDELSWTVEELFLLSKQFIIERYIRANNKKKEVLIKQFSQDK